MNGLTLPVQSPPVERQSLGFEGTSQPSGAGLVPSKTVCDGLTGLAQQMCYAVTYGV